MAAVSAARARVLRAVFVWLPGAFVLLLGPTLVDVSTERFGRVLLAFTMLVAVILLQRSPSRWAWALTVVAGLSLVVTSGAAEMAIAAVAVAITAVLLAVTWRRGVLGEDRVFEVEVPSVTTDGSEVHDWDNSRPAVPGTAGWLETDEPRSGLARIAATWAPPVLGWLAMAVPVNIALSVSGAAAGTTPDGRIVWDASNFMAIARDGYSGAPLLSASFPGYAMLIRAAGNVGVDHELAAILVSDAAGLLATVLFWRWCCGFLDRRPRLVALALFVTFPYSFVLFGVAYADGMLLAFIVGSLLAAERGRYLLAGVLAAGATFTRPNGLVIVPTLVVLVAERSGVLVLSGLGARGKALLDRARLVRFVPERFEARQLWVLLAPVGIGAYMWWMWRLWDDPLFFWTVQTTDYGHRAFSDPQTWLKVEFINRPGEFVHNLPDAVNQGVSFVLLVTCLVLLPRMGRRFGWAYAVLGIASVATLWVTASGFSPAGRYLLPFVPFVLALVAEPLGRHRVLQYVTLVVFFAGSVALAAAFSAAFRLNW